jgi:hypothetical protein
MRIDLGNQDSIRKYFSDELYLQLCRSCADMARSIPELQGNANMIGTGPTEKEEKTICINFNFVKRDDLGKGMVEIGMIALLVNEIGGNVDDVLDELNKCRDEATEMGKKKYKKLNLPR